MATKHLKIVVNLRMKMAEKASLLNYIERELKVAITEPTITKQGSDLETAIVSSYRTLQGNLSNVKKTNIFDIYLDARDINKDHVKRYLLGLQASLTAPYQTQGGNTWLRKLANQASEWRERTYREGDKYGSTPYEVVDFFAALGFIGGAITTVAGVVTGTPEATITGSSLLAALGSYASLFWKKTKLKPITTKFKKDQARDYILELRRFHLLCQEIEKEVADIERFDDNQKLDFIRRYGLKRMKQEGVSTKRLTKDETERRILEYGARDVTERIETAKLEVANVKKSIETILNVAGAEIIELDASYVPKGVRDYQQEHALVDRVEAELQQIADPHQQVEELRRKQAAKAKLTQ